MKNRRAKTCEQRRIDRRFTHTQIRGIQRHEMYITREQYEHLSAQIKKQAGGVKFIRKKSNRVTVWAAELNGKPVQCFYDKNIHRVLTVF